MKEWCIKIFTYFLEIDVILFKQVYGIARGLIFEYYGVPYRWQRCSEEV